MGMLILTRRVGERILIGADGPDQIVVEVKGVKGADVRIGIEAPREVPVHREEVQERIRKETAAAQARRHV